MKWEDVLVGDIRCQTKELEGVVPGNYSHLAVEVTGRVGHKRLGEVAIDLGNSWDSRSQLKN